ncbi:hypothetical protein NA56DRAFT_749722 [Hyaloscypha hepaticicola]|uniref:AA1-like domain-containing protein n=1 Tax=Hyaloscypha hepaticicola TaxID=2082293 RepID=A0A2J6Q1V9_9HELO|nr:hypothetical protein NA56DRAFT_749722 [Hyaloscypha hepaticicola]
MHFFKASSLLLSFVMLSSAFPKAPEVHVAQNTDIASRVNFTAFQIFNMTLLSTALPNISTHTLSFNFTDPNSNGTNTICNASWITAPNGTNTAPMSYVPCKPTNITTELFLWQFSSITGLTSFALRLAHQFSDPVHYPPPYSEIEYFSDVNVTLQCADAAGTCCKLPVLIAPIDNLAN